MSSAAAASHRALIGYGLVIAAAAYFLWEGRGLGFGRVSDIGPGFFPTVLALLMGGMALAGIGLELVARHRARSDARDPARAGARLQDASSVVPIDWKSLVIVSIALLAFAFSVRAAGLVPTVVLTFVLAALADRRARPGVVLLLACGLALLTWAVFVAGLSVSIPAFRLPW